MELTFWFDILAKFCFTVSLHTMCITIISFFIAVLGIRFACGYMDIPTTLICIFIINLQFNMHHKISKGWKNFASWNYLWKEMRQRLNSWSQEGRKEIVSIPPDSCPLSSLWDLYWWNTQTNSCEKQCKSNSAMLHLIGYLCFIKLPYLVLSTTTLLFTAWNTQ